MLDLDSSQIETSQPRDPDDSDEKFELVQEDLVMVKN